MNNPQKITTFHKRVANWIINDLSGYMKNSGMSFTDPTITSNDLGILVGLLFIIIKYLNK